VTTIPLDASLLARSSNQPGRPRRENAPVAIAETLATRRPYSVLLPAGLALPVPLLGRRCALTAPFHPCPV